MRFSALVLFGVALLSLSVTATEEERSSVQDVATDITRDERELRNQWRRKRNKYKKKSRSKNKNKYYYDYKRDDYSYDDYKQDDYSNGGGKCKLTACIKDYVYSRYNDYTGYDDHGGQDDYGGYDDYKGYGHDDYKGYGDKNYYDNKGYYGNKYYYDNKHYGDSKFIPFGYNTYGWDLSGHPGGRRQLWYTDVSGKVTLEFNEHDPHNVPIGYFPTWGKRVGPYYYAPNFVFRFNLEGLPDFTKGDVQVVDTYRCENVNPKNIHPYYDHYKIRNDPWVSTVGYSTGISGKYSKSVWVNNGYDCDEHVGKAVYVELPNSFRNEFGCGILYRGDKQC